MSLGTNYNSSYSVVGKTVTLSIYWGTVTLTAAS